MSTLPHNRYLIYSLLGHEVTFKGSRTNRRFLGIVNKVRRNIFDNVVELIVGGRCHTFSEPDAILEDAEHVVFVYGDLGKFDNSDSALFQDVRHSAFTECVDDVISRTSPGDIQTMRFKKGPKKTRQKREYRKTQTQVVA